MEQEKIETRQKEEKALLTFLQQTKDGKYTKVDMRLSTSQRVKEQREEIYYEDEYYYSVR